MYVLPEDINFNPNLSSTLKSFLRALEYHCGDRNTCWPSQRRIAGFMNSSVRTVQRMERQAVELGFIEVRRRWLKSNAYTVLCLEERKLSTMATEPRRIEQPISLKPKRSRTEIKTSREIQCLTEDICAVLGPVVSERNLGWIRIIARRCSWDLVQTSLQALRRRLMEAQVNPVDPIRCPSAWLTSALRASGAPI